MWGRYLPNTHTKSAVGLYEFSQLAHIIFLAREFTTVLCASFGIGTYLQTSFTWLGEFWNKF